MARSLALIDELLGVLEELEDWKVPCQSSTSSLSFPSTSQSGWFSLYSTFDRGFAKIARQEVVEQLEAKDVQLKGGKIFFSSNDLDGLRQLHSLEAVYLLLFYQQTAKLPVTLSAGLAPLARFLCELPSLHAGLKQWQEIFSSTQIGTKPEQGEEAPLSFKVTCKRKGRLSEHLESRDIAAELGACLAEKFGWRVNLGKDVPLHLHLHISDEETVFGIAVLKQAMVRAGIYQQPGLNPNVAFCMAMTVGVQPNDIVLDPMCGKGALLIEAAKKFHDVKNVTYLGFDLDPEQIAAASVNAKLSSTQIQLAVGDATNLGCVASQSVDVVLTDLPFGKQHGSVEGNTSLYPLVISEVIRVLKPVDGTSRTSSCIFLTNQENSELMDSVLLAHPELQCQAVRPISLGFMKSLLYLCRKITPALHAGAPAAIPKRCATFDWESKLCASSRKGWKYQQVEQRPRMRWAWGTKEEEPDD